MDFFTDYPMEIAENQDLVKQLAGQSEKPRAVGYGAALPLRNPLKENWISSTPNTWRKCNGQDTGSGDRSRIRCSSGGTSTPGRHIPRRRSMDTETANFKLTSSISQMSMDEDDDVFNESADAYLKQFGPKRQYRRRMACLSEGATNKRIYNFSYPERDRSIKRLSSSDKDLQPDMTYRRTERKLPKQSERILDLPNFEDNFFTHTMKWWTESTIISALECCVFICKVDGSGADLLHEMPENTSYSAVAVNKNVLACGTNRGELQLWDLETKKSLGRARHPHVDRETIVWPVYECRIGCIEWQPENPHIFITGCRNGQLDFWDKRMNLGDPQISKPFSHTQGTICGVKFNVKGKYLATGDSGHVLKIWDVNFLEKPLFEIKAHTSSVRAMAWHPREHHLLATGGGVDDGYIRMWNFLKTDKPILERFVKAQVCSLIWSELNNELISSQYIRGRNFTQSNQILVWNYPELRKIGNLLGHTGRVLHLDFSPSKTLLASAGGDETLRIWKVAEKKPKGKQWPSTLNIAAPGCLR